MTSRPLHLSVLAIGLASVLAACGGSSGGGTAAPTAAPTATPVPATWTFGGSTSTLTATNGQAPALVSLSAYRNISATLQFGAVSAGSGPIAVSDATNVGDVTPNTLPADNASTATPIIYFSLYNSSSTTISFGSATPVITVTNTAGFGTATSCQLDSYANSTGVVGGASTWKTIDTGGTINGTTATLPSQSLPSPNTVDLVGQEIVAISCR